MYLISLSHGEENKKDLMCRNRWNKAGARDKSIGVPGIAHFPRVAFRN